MRQVIAEHRPSHVFALFSGGHDSLCSTALAADLPEFTAAVHINTGVGIEETREFVRATCQREGWPLIEMHPDAKTYRDLVIEKGMPGGPKAHNPKDRIALVTGIRLKESERRMGAGISIPVRRQGAQLWVNPILDWTKADCHDFMEARGLERNRVVDLLHHSRECLCGALSHRSEMQEIETWYPAEAKMLHDYEQLARDHGHLEDVWAGRLREHRQQLRMNLELCQDCA
jgi:3'-phosphoadenosine 5'-phosphosulfate sulfotransferase (PAPS reductase)/FAD synthetase